MSYYYFFKIFIPSLFISENMFYNAKYIKVNVKIIKIIKLKESIQFQFLV